MGAAILAGWVICGILGAVIGQSRRAPGKGAALGFLFGPLGVLAAFAVDGRPTCPQCQMRIDGTPGECPRCRAALDLDGAPGIRFNCQHCGRELQADKVAGPADFMTCPYCRELTGIRRKSLREGKLQPCPDCGHEVSRRAKACPQCGCPIAG